MVVSGWSPGRSTVGYRGLGTASVPHHAAAIVPASPSPLGNASRPPPDAITGPDRAVGPQLRGSPTRARRRGHGQREKRRTCHDDGDDWRRLHVRRASRPLCSRRDPVDAPRVDAHLQPPRPVVMPVVMQVRTSRRHSAGPARGWPSIGRWAVARDQDLADFRVMMKPNRASVATMTSTRNPSAMRASGSVSRMERDFDGTVQPPPEEPSRRTSAGADVPPRTRRSAMRFINGAHDVNQNCCGCPAGAGKDQGLLNPAGRRRVRWRPPCAAGARARGR